MMINNDNKYLNLIKYNYFASLYLNGIEYNFHIISMQRKENPQAMAFEFFIDGYMADKYTYSFTSANDLLSTQSLYCVNDPDGKKIFNCQVKEFLISSVSKHQDWSNVSCHISIPCMAFKYGPYSSLEKAGFKLKEDSLPIGSNICSDPTGTVSQLINRAMLFDWEED